MSKASAKQRSNFYDSAEFNDLLEQARTMTDNAKRAELYKKADELATRIDYSIIPIYNESMFYMAKPYVKDFKVSPAYRFRFFNSDIDLAAKTAK
jgi:ABC-type transport system substrate-binding protein